MRVTEAAALLRSGEPSGREALASAAERAAARVLTRFRQVPPDEQEALANQVATRVVQSIERDRVALGKEEAYTHACARHAASDWLRSRRREGTLEPLFDHLADDEQGPPEERLDHKRTLELVERVLIHGEGTLAESYQNLLVALFVDGRTVEQIVDDELARGTTPATDSDRVRVRNRVDVQLKRARAALQRVLGELMGPVGEQS